MQEKGDLVLCDTFEITDDLLKFTKTSTKQMTKTVNSSIFFFLLINYFTNILN